MQVVFKVTSKGAIRFSKEFHTKLTALLKEVGDKATSGMNAKITVTTDELFSFVVAFNKIEEIPRFYAILEQRLVLLAEHGADADLFDELLSRHPELAGHPALPSVVGAWDNLMRKAKEVAADNTAPIRVERERRARAGLELGVEVFESASAETSVEGMSKAELRTASLRGEAPGQGKVKEAQGEPVIPEQYHTMMRGRGDKTGGNLPKKDLGDVMSASAKR